MKNKPLRHKEFNTFKFKPFSERISDINIDVYHRVGHKFEDDTNEADTFFYSAYRKWNNFNKSENYRLFKTEIDLCCVKTLPELLLKKEHVVSVLLEYLELQDPLSLQAFLELVVALARDLMQDFYIYYPQFHTKLMKLLNTRDTDQLEWVFTCFAYLFKSLWRYIIKDFGTIFDSLLPLLSDSNPVYISNFAADSFAFVARKVKDRRTFLKLILNSIYKTKDGVSGFGRLLFVTMSGVCNRFHSCAEPFLNFLLGSLVDEKLQRNILFQVLDNVVEHMISTISPEHSHMFWNVIQVVLEEFVNGWKETGDERFVRGSEFILQLMLKVIKWRDVLWLKDCQVLFKCLDLIQGVACEKLQTLVAEIISVILISSRLVLSQEQANFLINKVFSVSNRATIKIFVEKTFKYSGFDSLILPTFIDFSVAEHPDDTLDLWTKILLYKAPPPLAKMHISLPRRRYTVSCQSTSSNDVMFNAILLDRLIELSKDQILIDNAERIINILLMIPHFEPLKADCALISVSNLLGSVCDILQECKLSDGNKILRAQIVLLSSIECIISLKNFKNIGEINFPDCIVEVLSRSTKNLSQKILVLNCLKLLLNENSELFFEKIKNSFWHELIIDLSSPYHQVRLLSANILLHLVENENDKEIVKCLHLIVKVESLPTTVHDYREKLKILQRIECCPAILESKYKILPLHYLLGILYVNFKLLWEPIIKLITSYAIQLPKTEFWPVFHSKLLSVKEVINKQDEKSVIAEEISFQNTELQSFYNKVIALDDKPDYWNYRNILWKAMPQFSEVCESKNRDIVPLFLTFLQEEYYRTNCDIAAGWNVKLENARDHKKDGMEIDNENGNDNDDELNTETVSNDDVLKLTVPRKSATKSLLAHLCIFEKIHDPKSMYQEGDLRNAYYGFLTHKNPQVQKSAVECIMTYKFKHVLPYRDHLFGLIDDKSFKDEIVLFRIDQESDMVRPEHRGDLIPIVMRIIYSKMLNKSGSRTGSKSGGQLRRSLVFRFLAGCLPDEIMMYLRMAFKIFSPFIKDDAVEIVKFVDSTLDLENMIPPRRLQSSVNMLMVVLTQCGGLMNSSMLSYLLRILISIGQIVVSAFKQRDVIHPGYISTLRSVRNSSLDALSKFFSLFESFEWTAEELDTVFEVFIWPWLPKLPVEGVHSPTSLLKLFIVWSKFQRYFPLLGKHDGNGGDPLSSVMELLVGAKTHNSVNNAILEMVERLLLLQDLQEDCDNDGNIAEIRMDSDSAVVPLPINNAPVFQHEPFISSDGENLNYGSRLMMKHIPSVLERLKVKLSGRGVDRRLKKHELTILSRATELVSDPATSDVLLSLLLPTTLKKASAGDDIICPILNTLHNLIKNVCDPGSYISKLAPLFGIVCTAESRKLVTQVIVSISKKESEIDEELIEDLNAFDKRWIEQPDFDRRLDAFKRIRKDMESNNLSVSMGIIIIHNCFYFITNEKDLSIRDNAVQCLQYLCPALCFKYRNFHDLLMEKTILPLISSNIRNKKHDLVRQEAVILLGYMVRECSDLHPVLKDMSPLANKLDLEVDFFENLQHLQLHRRVRALLKLSDVLKCLKKSPCPRTIAQFLLPLVRQFLCEENYLNKNTIVDAAIMALENLCKFLSWHQYELILRYYLGKLQHNIQYQKQLVRVIVAILNGFHFDLSKASCHDEITKSDAKTNTKTVDENESKEQVEGNQSLQGDEGEDKELEEKEFEENLVKLIQDDDLEAEDSIKQIPEGVAAVDKIIVLNKSSATRVLRTIKSSLFAQLLRVISMRSQSDSMHKVNRKHLGPDKDEEDVLRIPIALAAVKLLQKLPSEFLQQNLPGILMKLCTFLKSRLDSVRRVTRETLQKVMVALGADYLPILINEMTQLLTKGFHVHVLIFTLHSVLVVMKDLFLPGHVEKFLPSVLQVCKLDLFGNASEEKEVAQITGKLMEARAHKSYDVFHILGEFVTENCLLDVIAPLKEELSNSFSLKVILKVTECLRNLVLGLVDNKFVSTESLLIFTYGVVSESIPSLATCNSNNTNTEEPERNGNQQPRKPTDTFIIPEDPKGRLKIQRKQFEKTNAHVLVEFGLLLYYFLLKRERVKGAEYRAHLDPIVPLLDNCLRSQHMKISTLGVQCLCWILKKDLPSLKVHVKNISQTMFSILHKYASSGLSKGENFGLVMATFKAVAVIVRDVKYYQLEREQLQALLFYCEQDINDHSRQATAFTLLKTILGRKLDVPELHQVILKVEELSITSNLDHSRLQARQIVHLFISEYKLGKKLKDHLNFYLTHLDYDLQTGRVSALEMLHSLINTLPQTVLKLHSGLLFVSIAARLVNDDAPECREKAAQLIISLLEKVNKNERNNLFDIVLLWLKDRKVAHQRLGAQLCGIFASVEKSDFENYLPNLFPLIFEQFYVGFQENKAGKLIKIAPEATDNERSTVSTMHDHHLYQLLNMLIKVVTFCPNVLTNADFTKDIEVIADNSQTLLGHPHEWVRSAAIELLGRIISVLNCEEIADIANGERPEKTGFFFNDTFQRIKSFALDHCYQLSPGIELNEKLLMQCMKNLVFIAEILQNVKSNGENKGKPLVSLSWLVRHMRKLIHIEVAQSHPPSTVVRTMVFHWMAAIALKLNKESLLRIAPHIIAPLVREMNIGDEGDALLKRVAKEASGYVKRKVGLEEYNRLVTTCTSELDIRRAERRKERAQQMIVAPEKAAKRKIMKQQKKKIQKKRKIEALKNHKFKREIKRGIHVEGDS